jgi:uncharacterized membrane protein YgcG
MQMMRRAAIALLVAIAAAGPAQAVERILRFVSDVEIERSGDLMVTETIRVQAEGNQIRRGILRDFPTINVRPGGSRVAVDFDVRSVTRDGADEEWTTEAMVNGVRVRIGRAEVDLPAGAHEYVIRYRTTRQIGFFADYDELYWNATGTGWTFAIDSAEARITLPQPVPFGQSAFYTGPPSARGRDAMIVEQRPGYIVFRTTQALPPGNGLTVAATWPKGIVGARAASRQTGRWLEDNLAGVVAGAGLAGVLSFYAFAWRRFGRDPPHGTIVPLAGPPAGMSAAAVRFVDQWGFDERCFTAAIADLGANGHIRLAREDGRTVIERCDGGKPIAPPEQAMECELFATGRSLALAPSNYEPLIKARKALQHELSRAYGNLLPNFFWSGLGLLLSFTLMMTTIRLMQTSYGSDELSFMLVGMLVPIVPIVAGAFLIRAGLQRDSGGTWFIVGGFLLILFFVSRGLAVMTANAHDVSDLLPGIVGYVVSPLSLLAFQLLQAPTAAGRAIMDRIEGFREYLGAVEADRLEALNPPDKTPELFERFLPYAIALDVENSWARRFAAALAEATAGGSSVTISSWYGDWGYGQLGDAHDMGTALSRDIGSAAAPGGGSGGGGSGGGGGGGGGGGW